MLPFDFTSSKYDRIHFRKHVLPRIWASRLPTKRSLSIVPHEASSAYITVDVGRRVTVILNHLKFSVLAPVHFKFERPAR